MCRAGSSFCGGGGALPWACIDGGSFQFSSSAGFNTPFIANLDPSAGFALTTNDATVFAHMATGGGGAYYGMSVLQHGLYRLEMNCPLTTAHAIAHGTKRAVMQRIGPGPGSHFFAYGDNNVPRTNIGGGASGIDASPQVWDLYETLYLTYTGTLPSAPWSWQTIQESGFLADSVCSIVMTRLGDAP